MPPEAASDSVAQVAGRQGCNLDNLAHELKRLQRKQIGFLSPSCFSIFRDMDNPIMTNLGETLRHFISEQDKQVAIARRWLELWRERFPKGRTWSPDTIESQLSRTLKSDPQGVRFFFDDPARATLLFEVLGIAADQHERIRSLASDNRLPGPRLVIDISSWPSRGESLNTLFIELRQKVLREASVKPAALVLTEEQYEQLPRSYDEQISQKVLSVHKVATAAEGKSQTVELADEAALVLAPWEFDPIERWLAVDFIKGSLSLEPSDGLAVFAEHGVLPSIPPVEHSLDAICKPAAVTFSIEKFTALQRRTWKYVLADETKTIAACERTEAVRSPAQRLAFAQQLGTIATSTARERLDHELDGLASLLGEQLKIPVEQLEPTAHVDRLTRAELRPTPPAAWRCGDTIHLLNIDAPIAHPRIEVHQRVAAVPALSRLLEYISGWTEEDYEVDPSLARAVETLDPDGKERPAFLHARATVLWNELGRPRRSAPPCERWADELRAALAGDPPPASLRLHLPVPEEQRDAALGLVFNDDDRLCALLESAPPDLKRPRTRRTLITERYRNVAVVSGSVDSYRLRIDKGTSGAITVHGNCQRRFGNDWVSTVYAAAEDEDGYTHPSRPKIPSLWIPKLSAECPNIDLWLDCVERSNGLADWDWEHSSHCEKLLRTTGASLDLLDPSLSEGEDVKITGDTWLEADLLLAQCWLALRAALAQPLSVKLTTGIVCSLGAGVCAHVDVRARRDGAPPGIIAAFDAAIATHEYSRAHSATIDYEALWTHRARVDNYLADFGLRVPVRFFLQTQTFSATIKFLAPPLLQASVPTAIGTLAATVAAQIADEDAAQAAYDDD